LARIGWDAGGSDSGTRSDSSGPEDCVNDTKILAEHNLRFIQACKQGSWLTLEPLLSRSFSYLDGATGEVRELERYIKDLKANPAPTLVIDQVVIHVDRDSAVVSARSTSRPGRSNRYLDTYRRHGTDWLCVHACVWPLPASEAA
jgi:hypothetical protein